MASRSDFIPASSGFETARPRNGQCPILRTAGRGYRALLDCHWPDEQGSALLSLAAHMRIGGGTIQPNGRMKGDMITLTRKDWSEIYYALETKSLALRQGKYGPEDKPGQDAAWIAHIEAVRTTIGLEGAIAAFEGVERGK